MPQSQVAYGVPQAQIGGPDPVNTLGTLATTTFGVTGGKVPTIFNRNTHRLPLPVGSYKVLATQLGYDPQGGYAMSTSTAAMSTAVTTTALGQGILCRIAATAYPANYVNQVALGLWLQVGSANYQLCDYVLINPTLDTSYLITSLPNSQSPFETSANLTGSTATPTLGSVRTPQAELLSKAYNTTGGVQLRHRKEGFTASPDSTLNFPVVTGRATDVSFRILNPTLQDIAQVGGGDYVSYVDTDTATTQIEQMIADIFSTQSSLNGNGSVLMTYSPDNAGRVLRRKFLGEITNNSDEFTEDNRKDAQTELQFTLSSANLDILVGGMATSIARKD